MNFDPAAPDLPLLPHPFAPVRDLDHATVDGDDDTLGEDLGCYLEREIQEGDPAKEGGVVGSLSVRMKVASFRANPSIWR